MVLPFGCLNGSYRVQSTLPRCTECVKRVSPAAKSVTCPFRHLPDYPLIAAAVMLRHTTSCDIGASRAGQCRFCWHQDIPCAKCHAFMRTGFAPATSREHIT